MRQLLAAVVLSLLALPALGPAAAGDWPMTFGSGTNSAESALTRRGAVTGRAVAERSIAFRPFAPDAAATEVALLPPFHGDPRVRAHEGIGYRYGRRGHAWLLSEWPRSGGELNAFARLGRDGPCGDVHTVGGSTKPRGVVWSTPRGLVFSLTPDGDAEPAVIFAEFRHLAGRGACR